MTRKHVSAFAFILVAPLANLASATTMAADDRDGCKKLLSEEGLNCAACIQDLPSEESCTRTAEDDAAAETAALFKGKGGTKIWNQTQFLFATDAVEEVEIKLPVANWNFLKDDPGKEQWTKGDIVIANELVSEVGLRFKGFYGSLRICLHSRMQCEKLSWKIKFNEYKTTQRFHGLKRLQLHASIHDETLMRERLTYSLWREMGVPAPRQTHVRVKVTLDDGTVYPLGVHVLTEQIDGRFTEAFKSGDKGDGNLYKEAWPGTGDVSASTFKNALRTNDNAPPEPNVQRLVDFGNAMASATNDYDLAMETNKFMKAKEAARYWAVDRAVEHWDGPVNFRVSADEDCEEYDYPIRGTWQNDDDCCTTKGNARCRNGELTWTSNSCGSGPGWVAYVYTCGDSRSHWNHNYYLYQEDETDVSKQEFRMIGWDVDSTWLHEDALNHHLGAGKAWDTPICSGAQCASCSQYTTGSGQQVQPGCFSTIRVWARGLRSEYMNAANELLAGPLQTCRLQSKIDRWKAALQPFIAQDAENFLFPATHYCARHASFSWDDEVTSFRNTIVPFYQARFRNSVACSRNYNANDWDAVTNKPLGPMLRLNEWQTEAWSPHWLTGTCLDVNSATSSSLKLFAFAFVAAYLSTSI